MPSASVFRSVFVVLAIVEVANYYRQNVIAIPYRDTIAHRAQLAEQFSRDSTAAPLPSSCMSPQEAWRLARQDRAVASGRRLEQSSIPDTA